MKTTHVTLFGAGVRDELFATEISAITLGGKGAGLAEMAKLNLPVPHGFTISTEVCRTFLLEKHLPDGIEDDIREALQEIERVTNRLLGGEHPLIVSVRSGAPVSMPGMMDTVLNLGLNDETVEYLAKDSGERFAFDCYRRFVEGYARIVLHIDASFLEAEYDALLASCNVERMSDTPLHAWRNYPRALKRAVESEGKRVPHDAYEQLLGAIAAVFSSWEGERAREYRTYSNISHALGTAVTVQRMVFGNLATQGKGSTPGGGSGVAFTRDTTTGETILNGEYLPDDQGENLVNGSATPHMLTKAKQAEIDPARKSMEELMPEAFATLGEIGKKLELHFREVQDIEFTVEDGQLFLLQTRRAKRLSRAAIITAVTMHQEGLITRDEALLRVSVEDIEGVKLNRIDPNAQRSLFARGNGASAGAATGRVVFTAKGAIDLAMQGGDAILVRPETSPEDVMGMTYARGILTLRGGITSHAALIARGRNIPCVVAVQNVVIANDSASMSARGAVVKEGDLLTIDGASGEVFFGNVPKIPPDIPPELALILEWADDTRRLGVRANADTREDARTARERGAEGIGLVRTEHMFFEPGRITTVREMILAKNRAERERALRILEPMQRDDLVSLFSAMEGYPVTIRLLDPPLHEFLPHSKEEMEELGTRIGVTLGEIERRAEALREQNPMLGLRGVRLGLLFAEIYDMQVRAIFAAARIAKAEPEIMVPLIATETELAKMTDRIREIAREFPEVRFSVGTMIELPRAAIIAGALAQHAEFFSFGTNDLTQTVYGLSRDDAGSFLPSYLEGGIFSHDPFITIDEEGVGALVQMAIERGRAKRPALKLGICGEHGGDARSIDFFERCGLDYVSCSPYRVEAARLAAAHAAIRNRTARK